MAEERQDPCLEDVMIQIVVFHLMPTVVGFVAIMWMLRQALMMALSILCWFLL